MFQAYIIAHLIVGIVSAIHYRVKEEKEQELFLWVLSIVLWPGELIRYIMTLKF